MRDEELVERLRHGYEEVSRGDIGAVLDLLDPDVEIRDRPEMPDARLYHGHDGARHAFQQTDDTFNPYRIWPTEIELRPVREGGRRNVVVVLHQQGEGRTSGVRVDEDIAHLFTFEGDMAVRLQVFSTPEEARAAAGIAR